MRLLGRSSLGELLRNTYKLFKSCAVFTDVLTSESQADGTATPTRSIDPRCFKLLQKRRSLVGGYFQVQMTMLRGPPWMKPAEIVARRSQGDVATVVRDARLTLSRRHERDKGVNDFK